MARRVPPGLGVADIGTDHALLAIYLALSDHSRRVIAIDSSPGSILVARRNCDRYGAEVDLRLGTGMSVLAPHEVKSVVLGGLGSETIVEILSEKPDLVRQLGVVVTQPMKDVPQLRRWARLSSVEITASEIVRDYNRLYDIIVMSPGQTYCPEPWDPSPTDITDEVTELLLDNSTELLLRYLERRQRIRRQLGVSLADARPEVSRLHLEVSREIRSRIRDIRGRGA